MQPHAPEQRGQSQFAARAPCHEYPSQARTEQHHREHHQASELRNRVSPNQPGESQAQGPDPRNPKCQSEVVPFGST